MRLIIICLLACMMWSCRSSRNSENDTHVSLADTTSIARSEERITIRNADVALDIVEKIQTLYYDSAGRVSKEVTTERQTKAADKSREETKETGEETLSRHVTTDSISHTKTESLTETKTGFPLLPIIAIGIAAVIIYFTVIRKWTQ